MSDSRDQPEGSDASQDRQMHEFLERHRNRFPPIEFVKRLQLAKIIMNEIRDTYSKAIDERRVRVTQDEILEAYVRLMGTQALAEMPLRCLLMALRTHKGHPPHDEPGQPAIDPLLWDDLSPEDVSVLETIREEIRQNHAADLGRDPTDPRLAPLGLLQLPTIDEFLQKHRGQLSAIEFRFRLSKVIGEEIRSTFRKAKQEGHSRVSLDQILDAYVRLMGNQSLAEPSLRGLLIILKKLDGQLPAAKSGESALLPLLWEDLPLDDAEHLDEIQERIRQNHAADLGRDPTDARLIDLGLGPPEGEQGW